MCDQRLTEIELSSECSCTYAAKTFSYRAYVFVAISRGCLAAIPKHTIP